MVWLTLEGRLPEHWHRKDTWPEFSLSPCICLCHGSFCNWESCNSLWLTPDQALGSPGWTCSRGLELIKDLRKTGIVYLVNCCKFRQRQTIPDRSTQISAWMPSQCKTYATLPPILWKVSFRILNDFPNKRKADAPPKLQIPYMWHHTEKTSCKDSFFSLH